MTVLQELRPDFNRIKAARNEHRSAERLAVHFEVEARLAQRLAASSKQERSTLYSEAYRQLFAGIDDHPQHRGDAAIRQGRIKLQAAFLLKSLGPGSTYVEVGCGDAALTKAIAPFVAQSIGVDVTPVLVGFADAAASFSFVETDGTTLGLPTGSADLVYSNQLMEHLHADDALEQLSEVFRVLKPGGRYVCSTPNRLTGPHDISCYFRYEPAGFHLREYDHRSLSRLFRQVGFAGIVGSIMVKGIAFNLPVSLIASAEMAMEALPRTLRSRLALNRIVSNMAGVTLIGTKRAGVPATVR